MVKELSSKSTIDALKSQFARHGIPRILWSDNGPQYSSQEFATFSKNYNICHITSSPQTPHSNGEAERAIQTVKKLWKKSPDKFLALLDLQTTPLEAVGLSPAQLLMGRRPRNLLPTSKTILQPHTHDTHKVRVALDQDKARQEFYYNQKRARQPQPTLSAGEEVRMSPHPGCDKWSPAVMLRLHETPRSFIVESQGRIFRRNRQDLRRSTSVANASRHASPELDDNIGPPSVPPDAVPSPPIAVPNPAMVTPSRATTQMPAETSAQCSTGDNTPYCTKSGRVVRKPVRLDL